MPVQDSEGQVFMNLSEIAERWGISIAAVSKYHVGGDRMPTTRFGKSLLVPVQDLSDYEQRVAEEIRAVIADYEERLERLNAPIVSL